MTADNLPVIVTDLDGTLLDHHTYSYAPAQPALTLIAERGYPLVLNSSKTRAEMLALQAELGLKQPFICENGAAIYLPGDDDWTRHAFAAGKDSWLDWIHTLRRQLHFPFAGFSDWSVEQIADITGLSSEKAALAAQREFSEPLLWQGDDQSRLSFEEYIAEKQLRLVRGGRFYSLQGQFDKARAMQWLRDHYRRQQPVTMIALGDSPNDCAMLNAADIAVIIQSPLSATMEVSGPQRVIRTTLPGPEGWQQAMTTIMNDLDQDVANKGASHG